MPTKLTTIDIIFILAFIGGILIAVTSTWAPPAHAGHMLTAAGSLIGSTAILWLVCKLFGD